jgi:hypothetical protein
VGYNKTSYKRNSILIGKNMYKTNFKILENTPQITSFIFENKNYSVKSHHGEQCYY